MKGDLAEMAMSEQYLRTKQAMLLAKKKETEMKIAQNIASLREAEVLKMKEKVKHMQVMIIRMITIIIIIIMIIMITIMIIKIIVLIIITILTTKTAIIILQLIMTIPPFLVQLLWVGAEEGALKPRVVQRV